MILIAIIVFALFIGVIAYSCCAIAGRADDRNDKMWGNES